MIVDIRGSQFIDEHGRSLHLRGVNLGGSSKVPRQPNGSTWNKDCFFNHHQVSFIGRPFPLEEADEHYSRLKKWGLTFLRFLITWEAVEHEAPGIYDQGYLDYLFQVVKKAGEHDLYLFIDPHQDVWSRFSGGDGAPGWTFEVLGMDLTQFMNTGAAFTHQGIGTPYPRMLWTSNYSKFACATMWTLFYGGNVFAPETRVQGIPAQDFLQDHLINAVNQVVERLKGFDHVLGYETGNEPSQGFIGYADVNSIPSKVIAQGPSPSILQGMLLAAGFPQRVRLRSVWSNLLDLKRTTLLDPQGANLWQPGVEPIWKRNGVWDIDQSGEPYLLSPDHFAQVNGHRVDFDQDFFIPFVKKYAQAIQKVDPDTFIFLSPTPSDIRHGPSNYGIHDQEGIVHAPHWYDGFTVRSQTYLPWLGIDNQGDRLRFILGRNHKRKSFRQQIKRLAELSYSLLGGVPTVIAETGIPYNMGEKSAYQDGNFSAQISAMDDTLQALEANAVNFTLWNYTADNTNQHGDQWNEEDFSIFCRDQDSGSGDIHDGGRALQAVLRPYVYKTPGKLLRMSFNIGTKVFTCSFDWDAEIRAPVELFVPEFQYPHGFELINSHGDWFFHPESQVLEYTPTGNEGPHYITIAPRSPRPLNDQIGNYCPLAHS